VASKGGQDDEGQDFTPVVEGQARIDGRAAPWTNADPQPAQPAVEGPPGLIEAVTDPSEEVTMPAHGSAEWKGDVPSGAGTFTAGDSISGGYTFKSRFEDGPGSNPEQLIAAAHAACFSMALSSRLAQAGNPPDLVHTDATVTLRPVDGAPTITKIALVTVGRVPGLDEAAFVEHAQAAKVGCPVSRALAGVPEITLEASLVD
jgi:lipoyl-dependent peroxiredoxin